MGTIFTMGSIWMGMFFLTSPILLMGWGPETPAARPYPKSWHQPPPPRDSRNSMSLALSINYIREKGRDLTQSYDKSPYTNRNVKRAK